jgi:hypothetical protein
MSIVVHRMLGAVLQIAGFFGGAIVGAGVGMLILMAVAGSFKPPEGRAPDSGGSGSALTACCGLSIGVPLFFGGAWVGRTLAYGLFVRRVPARCPQCRGPAYFQSEGNEVHYRCRSCKHVYVGASWQE